MVVDVKRSETIVMVEKAIDKLGLFLDSIKDGTVTVEDISINQRLRSDAGEVIGLFNMNIDIDYYVKLISENDTKSEQ